MIDAKILNSLGGKKVLKIEYETEEEAVQLKKAYSKLEIKDKRCDW